MAGVASSLFGTQLVTSGLGVVFWALAARGSEPSALGLAGPGIAVMGLLGTVSSLGLGTLTLAELPRTEARERRPLLTSSVLACAGAGTLFGAVFLLAVLLTTTPLEELARSPFLAVTLVLGVAATAVSRVLDQAMLVLGPPVRQVYRNALASALKLAVLPLLLALLDAGAAAILGAWTVGLLVGNLAALVSARTTTEAPGSDAGLWAAFRRQVSGHGRTALTHHVTNIALVGPITLLPVLVGATATREDSAVFTLSALVAGFLFLAPYSLSIALLASSSVEEHRFAERARQTFWVALGLAVAGYAGTFLLAGPVLSLFGQRYADAVEPLRLLALAAPLLVVKDQYVAVVRSRRLSGRAAAVVLPGALLEAGGAALGAHLGQADGCALGFVAGLALSALFYVPALRRQLWGPPAPSG